MIKLNNRPETNQLAEGIQPWSVYLAQSTTNQSCRHHNSTTIQAFRSSPLFSRPSKYLKRSKSAIRKQLLYFCCGHLTSLSLSTFWMIEGKLWATPKWMADRLGFCQGEVHWSKETYINRSGGRRWIQERASSPNQIQNCTCRKKSVSANILARTVL